MNDTSLILNEKLNTIISYDTKELVSFLIKAYDNLGTQIENIRQDNNNITNTIIKTYEDEKNLITALIQEEDLTKDEKIIYLTKYSELSGRIIDYLEQRQQKNDKKEEKKEKEKEGTKKLAIIVLGIPFTIIAAKQIGEWITKAINKK